MSARRFTNAPSGYDSGTTRTVRVVGTLAQGRGDLREVEVEDEDLEWQASRYLSGLYECWAPADFDLLARVTGLVKRDPQRDLPATDDQQASHACDLCAEYGMHTAAVADVRTPGGMWANVCEAHRVRLGSRCSA